MPFDPEPFASGLRKLNDREQTHISDKAARARDEAVNLARLIGESDHAIRTVYLFGSLACGDPSRLDFDIDLAIDGGDVFAAESFTEDSVFPCDVVSFERLPAHVRERIIATGVMLYARDGKKP